MKKIVFVMAMLLGSLVVVGQGGANSFDGKVVDAITLQPIASAYVAIPSIGYGTATNPLGDFHFSYPRISADSQVVVSAMGYKNFYAPATGFTGSVTDSIKLTPQLVVPATPAMADAKAFVKAALDSIGANYPSKSVFQNGFYRETVTFENVGLVKINEGVLRVERFPQPKNPTDKAKYIHGRKVEWEEHTSKMGGYVFQNGASIVIRSLETSLPNYLTDKEVRNYEFVMDSVATSFDDLPVYAVSFEPKNRRVEAARSGRIYIEPTSKAIVRIEYEMTPEAARSIMSTGVGTVKMEGKSVQSYTQFRKYGNKWMLQDNAIKFGAAFEEKFDGKMGFVNADITIRFITTTSQPLIRSSIPDDRQLTTTDDFPRVWQYPDDIWQGHNYLVPTHEMRQLVTQVR